VIVADDPGYDAARATFNGMIDRRPEVVTRALDVDDVVTAVTFARDAGLPVSIRGGGHGVAGLCVGDGSLVVDLRLLRDVSVDPAAMTVTCGGGALWEDLDPPCQRHGLATPGGTFGDTGVAGLTLGGGIGHLTGVYGLTLDSLLAATVVTADGAVVRASRDENEELFWALRGGGGNFGVVVEFTFQLHPVGLLLGGLLLYRLEDAEPVVAAWRALMESAPDELMCSAVLSRSALAGERAGVSVAYLGDPEEGRELIRPLLDAAPPTLDGVRPMYYAELQDIFGRMPFGLRNYWSGRFLHELPDDVIELSASHARQKDTSGTILFEPLHGQAGRLQRDVHRLLAGPRRGRAPHRDGPRVLGGARALGSRRRLSQLRLRAGRRDARDGVRQRALRASARRETPLRPGERLPVQPQHRAYLIFSSVGCLPGATTTHPPLGASARRRYAVGVALSCVSTASTRRCPSSLSAIPSFISTWRTWASTVRSLR
jgi:hypothetical protein